MDQKSYFTKLVDISNIYSGALLKKIADKVQLKSTQRKQKSTIFERFQSNLTKKRCFSGPGTSFLTFLQYSKKFAGVNRPLLLFYLL